MENKYSGAITLGYASLFVTLWLFFMPFKDWYCFESGNEALPILMVLGGVVLAIAGIFCLLNEAKVESVIFLVMAAAQFSYMMRLVMYPDMSANTNPSIVDGWILFLVAVVIFYVWLASLKIGMIKQLFLLALWIALLGGAISNWLDVSFIHYITSYLGLIAALLAGWLSASTILPKKESSPPSAG
jgi:succinate-acetate transporter protein